MRAFVVRVWLPDRPGALGAVASRIGSVRGDVVGIEILERGAGKAIDELVVTLPDHRLLDLLVSEITQVDGVDVEDVRPLRGPVRDLRLEALQTARRLVEADGEPALLDCLCADALRDFAAEWAAVLDGDGTLRHRSGEPPDAAWLRAFVAGSRTSEALASASAGPEDVAWAPLPVVALDLVVGRQGRPFRARERQEAAALARIAELRLAELRRAGPPGDAG